MIYRVTGSGFVKTGAITNAHPVEFRHWKEVVDDFDNELEFASSSEEEQAVIELWLEYPASFQVEEAKAAGMSTGMLRRADNFGSKQALACVTNWDSEFADAQAHVASVLKNLGNTH